MANAVLGLAGFGFCCLALHLTAEPLGKWAALAIALTVSVGWSFGVLFARKCGLKV
jgi:hypothetical protein